MTRVALLRNTTAGGSQSYGYSLGGTVKRIFFSDLHLEDSGSEVFRGFVSMVRHEARIVDEIYILGDLVECGLAMTTSQAAEQIVSVLREASADAAVFVVHGNRDFLLGDHFCERTGATAVGRPFYSR